MDIKMMETAQAIALINDFKKNGVVKLGFAGGESLHRKDIDQLLEYSHKSGLITSISSNGKEIYNHIDAISKYVDVVQLSLDGPKDVHDELRGYTFTSPPFGYRMENNMLIPVLEEAEIVVRIYKEYLSGMGVSKIVAGLNSDPDVPRKPWTKEGVRYILSNEKYVGDNSEELSDGLYQQENKDQPWRNGSLSGNRQSSGDH